MTLPKMALSIRDACEASCVGRTKIYQAIAEGQLPARKLGTKTLILQADLVDWLDRLPLLRASKPRVE